MNINSDLLIEEAKRVLSEEIHSLELVNEHLDENFAKAVMLISESKKIIVSGVGKSGIIAKKIAATFSSITKPAVFLHPVDALHGDIGIVQKGDAAILLSKSGSTEEIVTLVPYLKARSIPIIAIVGNPNSYLSHNSDISLNSFVDKEACTLNLVPTSSTLVALALGDALASCLMKVEKLKLEDFSKQHPLGQLGRNITLIVKDVMHKNSNLPFVFNDSSFRDALIEISRKGMGCVCVLDEKMHLLGIITDGDVRRVLQKYPEISTLKVEDAMTLKPISISPDSYLVDAIAIMEQRESQISVLPVIDSNDVCVGIIRIHDILRSSL